MPSSLPRWPTRRTSERHQMNSLYDRALEAEAQIVTFHTWHRRAVRNVTWLPHAWHVHESLIARLPMLSWLAPIGFIMWVFLILPMFALREAWQLGQARRRAPPEPLMSGRSVYLGTSISDMLPAVAKSVPVPDVYLALPWRTLPQNLPFQMKVMDLAGHVQARDVRVALATAWTSTLRHCLTPAKQHLVLYGYMGFRWHLVYLVLKRIAPAELWISNHYDRWAILVDGIGVACKTMVQHGQLKMQSKAERITVGFKPDPKLKGHWRLLHFTPNALSEFTDFVFNSPPYEQISFAPEFEVFDTETDKPVVLMVGSPHIQRDQMAELKALRQAFGSRFVLYYRPHPRAGTRSIDATLQDVNATVVPRRLPRGALCITYPSTLNDSLERLGIAPLFDFDYSLTEEVIVTRKALHEHLAESLGRKPQERCECAE